MRRPRRIAIASAGRFHVLDLARELHALGYNVKFYSYVPRSRARKFGLPPDCHVSLLAFALPFLAWERLARPFAPKLRERLLYASLNWGVKLRLQPCDMFLFMSGIYLEAAASARKRYGAKLWLIRGSRHILSQDEILAQIPGAERPSALTKSRELAGYALSDRIDIPSGQVRESFDRDTSAKQKLFLNAYGVDLAMFPYVSANRTVKKPATFLNVGQWSLRKGCDVLLKALGLLDEVRLRHVGTIVDLPFPTGDLRFEHIDSVQQWELSKLYSAADVLVQASREDGFGVVLAQALACGLPIVCTDRTGGADLAHTPALAARIKVVPHDNAEALAQAMVEMRDRLFSGSGFPPLTQSDLETLSWSAYARRYRDELERDFARV